MALFVAPLIWKILGCFCQINIKMGSSGPISNREEQTQEEEFFSDVSFDEAMEVASYMRRAVVGTQF